MFRLQFALCDKATSNYAATATASPGNNNNDKYNHCGTVNGVPCGDEYFDVGTHGVHNSCAFPTCPNGVHASRLSFALRKWCNSPPPKRIFAQMWCNTAPHTPKNIYSINLCTLFAPSLAKRAVLLLDLVAGSPKFKQIAQKMSYQAF